MLGHNDYFYIIQIKYLPAFSMNDKIQLNRVIKKFTYLKKFIYMYHNVIFFLCKTKCIEILRLILFFIYILI